MIRAYFHKQRWGRWMMLIFILLLFSACYQMDDDEPGTEMSDRREAQAYIVSSYNKLNEYMASADFDALAKVHAEMGNYKWENKEEMMEVATSMAKLMAQGDLSVLRKLMDYGDKVAGVYEADVEHDSTFYKKAEAQHQLRLIFNKDVDITLSWDEVEKTDDSLVVNLSFDYNAYRLSGQTRVYADSVCSQYRMTKGEVCLMRMDRDLKGEDILKSVYSDPKDSVYMFLESSDLRLQMMDLLCLHDTELGIKSILDYLLNNYELQAKDPKAYLQGWINLKNNMSRIVLTRPDGQVLCKITQGMQQQDGKEVAVPQFHWGDGTQQSLTEFASTSANQSFVQVSALISKIWQFLYGDKNGA